MFRLKPLLRTLALAAVAGSAASCTAVGDATNARGNVDGLLDAGRDVIVIDSGRRDGRAVDGQAMFPGSELCGIGFGPGEPASCGGRLPDDPAACADYTGESHADAAAAEAGTVDAGADARARDASPEAAPAIDSGVDGSPADASTDGRTDASGVALDAGGTSAPAALVSDASQLAPQLALGAADGGMTPPRYACQVQRAPNGEPHHRCAPAGEGQVGAPCTASKDCSPGMACVGGANSGRCRPTCCDESGCAPRSGDAGPGFYCSPQPLRDDLAAPEPLKVPVCMPGHDCRLDEPFPCDESEAGSCSCGPNTVCTVVRSDGTRACLAPGTRTAGESCATTSASGEGCAPGLFCSRTMHTCVKVCKTDRDEECGSGGRCQATASFPVGFGLCVGGMTLGR